MTTATRPEKWVVYAAGAVQGIVLVMLAVTFVVIAVLPDGASGARASGRSAVARLGCSALLPLTIGFGEEELAGIAAALAGGVIAFYQLGYGLAAFGVGPLLDHGVSLPTVYAFSALVAAAMGFASFGVTRAGRREGELAEVGSLPVVQKP